MARRSFRYGHTGSKKWRKEVTCYLPIAKQVEKEAAVSCLEQSMPINLSLVRTVQARFESATNHGFRL